MKRLSILLFTSALMTGGQNGLYIMKLEKVEKDSIQAPGTISKVDSANNTLYYVFDQPEFEIKWAPNKYDYKFALKNKSGKSMAVVWNDARHIFDSEEEKVFSDESSYENKDREQGTIGIDKDSVYKGTVNISSRYSWRFAVYSNSIFGNSPEHWEESPIIPDADSKSELESLKSFYINSVFKIKLPIKINDVTENYYFSFRVVDFKLMKWTKRNAYHF